MKHLLKMSDLSPAELHHILDVAEELKAEQKAGTTPALLIMLLYGFCIPIHLLCAKKSRIWLS